MPNIVIREPTLDDKDPFIIAMQRSRELHYPWVKSPTTPQEFTDFLHRHPKNYQTIFLACNELGNITGVFNISGIVRGLFQSAYLGFYATIDFAGQGYMSAGLKLVLKKVFNEMGLHRLEANIQPENIRSINLVNHNGFKKEGFSPRYLKVNDEWRDHERWAITFEDFNKTLKQKLSIT